MTVFINSPLEQFQIFPVWHLFLSSFDFSITNATVIIILGLSLYCFIFEALKIKEDFFLIPNRIQVLVEGIFITAIHLIKDSVGKKGQEYFPFVFSVFSFVLTANLIGLIPCSFTITSHLSVAFALSGITFFGLNLICLREHNYHLLILFLPSGSSLSLAFILVPIEFVSYFVRPISLAVRLFANMMAGHTLLKVIAGFAWIIMATGGFLFVGHFIPLVILVVVMALEMGVALIQSYVFTVLTCSRTLKVL
jgi:ATP synthase subunit 6